MSDKKVEMDETGVTWQSEGWVGEGGVRVEGMQGVSVSPAWWGVEAGAASAAPL